MTPASDGGNLTAERPTPPRSRHRLHNFSFPNLSWGSQRILRCKSPVTAQKPQPPPPPPPPPPPLPEEAVISPWNLRTRRFRSSGNAPISQSNGDKSKKSVSAAAALVKSEEEEKDTERESLSVSLTMVEIEEDFVNMRGTRPHRRPKKRPRIVQRKLDRLFPGLWLCDITEDSYKTND